MNKAMIPNLFTLSNCLFGMLSVVASINHNFILAALFIVIAVAADAMDGRVARFFEVASEMGKQLDSLSDAVSFGAAPAILLYQYDLHRLGWYGAIICAVYTMCGVWRLARFNISTAEIKGYFQGLPIPGGGIAIAAFVFSGHSLELYGVISYILLMGFLMVSSIKYPDFKNKCDYFGKTAWIIAGLLAVATLLNGCFSFGKVFFALVALFVMYGLINSVIFRKAKR
ncbi:MAG: CDP-diacylglycerol--serine O-phosphatidyltransferase [Negativicutes bacterium]|jgi:CDP-diacylglycerol--serine O-phosphatidyltransferase